ncbi:intradiol ring-cleavage dioxygenase [Anabaena cylindrica FACHB-243]|uniref:Intradiol ring-cleavage dioxygenase n=1 Tax=Anabaena cylindrica (strain ATCC 27899 / PCC 7122) TaxID=272123 RepID=K9ZNF7_ANACC|nr:MULTISPECIES: intradiol ring-cleavage dioxygenase [Anabaena]AFZ60758.1 intradiol ring-cleavage dioxygenase [Anabaena cylindrica PCC 7122]MBD2419807.1 intradiol ring-cleavage dioxygenase [Anabaena cylindrica FACHB-243]MBY5281332.1 intradiol ring-cleavage dioxygenase [Anabaena sp. CCAP 1446/1C]MBY5309019.1 intradiol ring-cleavage dioxygenase [Anabaena sp. CCAP 1446/1C]MCM2406758.1 intradiol ring-cleavage dioxygenase [Anabaena sp. CCAP 1446/1C]
MKNNHQLGRILTRREVLALFRATGTAILVVGCTPKKSFSTQAQSNVAIQTSSTPACVVSPEQTEGPYFIDEKLKRSDIRSDPADGSVKEGVPLQLTLHLSFLESNACIPLVGAIVDVWHCDALGVYSDVTDRNFNTVGKKFLRGYQLTDAKGNVQFTTIYPGWYQGRTVHIHFKVRTNGRSGQSHEFTSQLYFDDAVSDRVYSQAPYASKGQRSLKNTDDRIFAGGGEQMLLKLTKNAQGYAATFDVGLQMT